MTVLVEGFEPDQVALAAHLAEGSSTGRVRLAGPGAAPAEALALAASGVAVEQHVDLDANPGPAETAYLDVWTPAVAPRVDKLRRRGARVTNLGDLLLARATGVTVGITGTAGKTTATSIAVQLLRATGVAVDASRTGRLGNLWPTADLIVRPDQVRPLVLELTSSHLAFMRESPHIAAITGFWPDHLELHGSLADYRAAKETIVRGQRPGDTVVVNADDPQSAAFAGLTPADLVEVSLERPVARGAFVARERVAVSWDDRETDVGAADRLPCSGPSRVDVLVALAVAVAAGAPPGRLAAALAAAETPPYRARRVGVVAGVPVIDDGMAATPSKTAATLAAWPDRAVVLVAGGMDVLSGGPVHAAPEEQELLERACDEVARSACLAVLFGPAGRVLEPPLERRGVDVVGADRLEDAVTLAVSRLQGLETAGALLFSPMFPVTLVERERFAGYVHDAAGRLG